MCGVIGQFSERINQEKFKNACLRLRHRGPDDFGYFFDVNIALGHNRLSIIDLTSSGHQPMVSNDGRFVIVYNGELFNYLELKNEIGNRYDFRGSSDTEVLLAAYSLWGLSAIKKFNGQFSFAIWDKEKSELFLARDQFGIKPLFYFFDGENLFFSSEIKGLLKMGVEPIPNDGIIFDYLAYQIYDHSDETFFKNIFSLPKGSYALLKSGALKITRYWDLAEEVAKIDVPKSFNSAMDEFRGLMEDSIRIQLRSDVPIGINLSSGIDSSTLFYLSEKFLDGKIHAFSSCLSDDTYNECKFIAPWLNTQRNVIWHTSTMDPSMVWDLSKELSLIEDQPFGGMHTLQYYNLYKQTADSGIKVLLEGQGMDEILAGYENFSKEKRGKFINSYINPEIKPSYLDGSFINQSKLSSKLRVDQPFDDELRNAQYIDIYYRKLSRPLRFNDHISMAFSKELRVPFLDHRLVAYGVALPEEYKINNGTHKYLLRKIIERDIPHAMRPKDYIEFPAFQTLWFRKYFRDEVLSIINSSKFRNRPYWNIDKLRKEVDQFFSGDGSNSFFLWQVINLDMWFNQFIDDYEKF